MTILCWADINYKWWDSWYQFCTAQCILLFSGLWAKTREKQFKEERACLGSWFERIKYGDIGMIAEAWDSWSHSARRQEAEINTDVLLSSAFPLLIHFWTSGLGMVLPTFRLGLLSWMKAPWSSSTDLPELCLLGDLKSSQVNNEGRWSRSTSCFSPFPYLEPSQF